MTTLYASRVLWDNGAAITWRVTRPTPREGLEVIIDNLRTRYNLVSSDVKFELLVPPLPIKYNKGTRVKLDVKKASRYYGNIAMVYQGTCTDTSTHENKLAQKYWVFFNFGKESYNERNFFVPGK